VLSRSVQQLDARHQHALLTVTSQTTLDLLMKVADAVGLQIVSIEPSLIALSRAQARLRDGCRDACLLIQLNESAAELGICHRGRLLLDYRPGGNTSAENIADVVDQHHSRLERYLNRYHSYLAAPLRHIYLTGEPAAVEAARQRFSRLPNLHVQVLAPAELAVDWRHAGAAPGTEMSAALGTALSLLPDAAECPAPNLIESTLAQIRAPMRTTLVPNLAPIAALLFVAAMLLVVHVWNLGKAKSLRAELVLLQSTQRRAEDLRLQLIVAEAKLAQLRQLQERLPRPDWQRFLTRIGQCMPDDVWLDRLNVRDGRFASLGGASFTDAGVYDLVSYLKEVPDIAEISLEGTGVSQGPSGPTTTFDLKATLADFATQRESEGNND
jgi:hypothetical protein